LRIVKHHHLVNGILRLFKLTGLQLINHGLVQFRVVSHISAIWMGLFHVPQIEEILVESGSRGDNRSCSLPVLTRSLLYLGLLNPLIVGDQSGFILVGVRLGDQAAQSLEIRRLALTLFMHLRAQETQVEDFPHFTKFRPRL